jgi:GST-like protein
MSSATPVACALTELGVQHELVLFDLSKNEQKSPEFLKLNPNGKVPTLVVDGTPIFEALAIIQWLGDRYGVAKGLWPAADSPARLTALAWSTWAYVTYGPMVMRLHFATSERLAPEYHNAAQAELARKELQNLLAILEGRLSNREYLLGDAYSLADLVVSGSVGYSRFFGTPLDAHPRVAAWLERCMSRPAVKAHWTAGK